MKKILLFILLGVFCQYAGAVKKSVITATVTGYTGQKIYFDFIQQPEASCEFEYREGQPLSCEVELEDITMLKINSWVWICLKPGDSINIQLKFEDRSYREAEFSGAEDVVAVNNTIRDMRMLRVKNRYKTNVNAALVTLVPADKYHAQCLEQWEKEIEILNGARRYMSDEMYNFLLSEHEAIFLNNLIIYPFMRASYDGKNVEEIFPEGYWDVLDDYVVRSDKGSLRSDAYAGFLVPYEEYVYRRELRRAGGEWGKQRSLAEGFDALAKFYDKNLRDAALCVYLYNAAAEGRDFEEIDKLTERYLKNYNKNKRYKKMLLEVMQ